MSHAPRNVAAWLIAVYLYAWLSKCRSSPNLADGATSLLKQGYHECKMGRAAWRPPGRTRSQHAATVCHAWVIQVHVCRFAPREAAQTCPMDSSLAKPCEWCSKGMSWRNFIRLFPDMKNNLRTMCPRSAQQEAGKVLEELGYDGAPQHVSMWACLALCKEVVAQDLQWLERNTSSLTQLARAYIKHHGLAPHPGTVC